MKTIPWRFFIALTLIVGAGPGIGTGVGFGAGFRAPWLGALVGIATAFLAVTWCAIWYRRTMRRRDPAFSFSDANAYREATVELPLAAAEAFPLCLSAVEAQPSFYLNRADAQAGEINGLTGGGNAGYFSFGSPGERISVLVKAASEGTSSVQIKSRPGTVLMVLDFGKNRSNVSAISRWLNDAVQRRFVAEREAAERAEMARALTAAKLSALQAQIEPHFLYNTLANAQSLTRSDPARADIMLGHLITYLRAGLQSTQEAQSTLGREIERARAYLEILKIRMGDRLRVTFQLAESLAAIPFPPMMLQTLVENAIKHGLEPKPGNGTIAISVTQSAYGLQVTVADNGIGFSEGTAGTGIGLKNIRERLQLIYRESASLLLTPNVPAGVRATITLPNHVSGPR